MSQIIICGGGSGGHILPAVALADELDKRKIANILVTDPRGQEFLPKKRSQKTPVLAGGDHSPDLKARLMLLKHWFKMTKSLLKEFGKLRPGVIVCFGGYFTPPLAIAGKLRGARLVLHEQNTVIGGANRLLSHIADLKTCASGAVIADAVTVGIPITPAKPTKKGGKTTEPPNKKSKTFVLSALGGSQGSEGVVKTLLAAMAKLPPKVRRAISLNLQCRKEGIGEARSSCKKLGIKATLKPFFSEPLRMLAASNLLVTRAGAGSLNAALVAGRAAIALPYPYAANRHQHANAAAFVKLGAGWMVEDGEDDKLAELLLNAFEDRKQLAIKAKNAAANGAPHAAEKLAQLVLAMEAMKPKGKRNADFQARE